MVLIPRSIGLSILKLGEIEVSLQTSRLLTTTTKKLHRNKGQADKAYYEKYVTKSAEEPNTSMYLAYFLWGSFTLTCVIALVVILVDASY